MSNPMTSIKVTPSLSFTLQKDLYCDIMALICPPLFFYVSSFDIPLWCGNLCLSWSSTGWLLFPIKPEKGKKNCARATSAFWTVNHLDCLSDSSLCRDVEAQCCVTVVCVGMSEVRHLQALVIIQIAWNHQLCLRVRDIMRSLTLRYVLNTIAISVFITL